MVDTLFMIEKGIVKQIIELSNHPDHINFTKTINNPVAKIMKEEKDCQH